MSEHAMNFMPSEGFRARSKEVVENPFLRKSFRGAMDFLIDKRAAQFPDTEELESAAHAGRTDSPVQPGQAAGSCWCNWKPG
jgi:L-lactate dehydrogenase complex protein LldF